MDESLKKFVAVVEAGTFTRAAEILHVSQPALSVAVSKLEKTLKVRLLEKSGRQGIVLSNAGRQVYAAALEHRRVEHDLNLQLVSLAEEKVPLRIGMIDSVAELLCAQDEPLRTLESSTELGLYVMDSTALRQAVRRSELDIAVVVADDVEDDRLEVAAVTVDRLLLVAARGHQKSMEEHLSHRTALPFLSYVQHSATQTIIARALARDNIEIEPILYSTSPDIMLAMVERGRGVTVLPASLVAGPLSDGKLVQLSCHGKPYYIERRLHVVTLKGRKLPPRLAALAFAMREQLHTYAK